MKAEIKRKIAKLILIYSYNSWIITERQEKQADSDGNEIPDNN